MGTVLAVQQGGEGRFNERQVRIIREQIAKGTSEDEFAFFLEVCQMTGLNPFQRQIYAIMRGVGDKRKMTIQTGIDGYRLVAARTGQLAGIDDAVYDTEEADNPNRASVTVWRFVEGHRVPFTATARWKEYKPQPPNDAMWGKMPYLMLGKCAESLALRKAFPAELSGIYTGEEMAQADADMTPYVEAAPAQSPSPASAPTPIRQATPDRKPATTPKAALGPTPDQVRVIAGLCAELGRGLPDNLTLQNAGKTIFELKKELRERPAQPEYTFEVDETGEMLTPDPERPHALDKVDARLGA